EPDRLRAANEHGRGPDAAPCGAQEEAAAGGRFVSRKRTISPRTRSRAAVHQVSAAAGGHASRSSACPTIEMVTVHVPFARASSRTRASCLVRSGGRTPLGEMRTTVDAVA